jgi:hypothetical protein
LTTYLLNELSLRVGDLISGVSYEFHVLAENRAGASAPSMPTLARDPWQKPAAPVSINISEVTKRSCKVREVEFVNP